MNINKLIRESARQNNHVRQLLEYGAAQKICRQKIANLKAAKQIANAMLPGHIADVQQSA
jgi:hypothetical protein